jgi:hypothetical protein
MSKIQLGTPTGSVVRDMTVEEQTFHDDLQAQAALDKTADIEAKAQLATTKANAKAKLIAGEALTEAEADTIVL